MWILAFKNFMTHKKLWHAMTNISAINLRHTKTYGVTKKDELWWKFETPCCQMPCYHHMEDRVIISCKGQQYFQLVNKWN
jgi:hypothetical protein